MIFLRTYKGYLIDLDGTIYRGNERIEGAAEFITNLMNNRIPYLFLTNNSAYTQEQIANKLNQMNIRATPNDVFTSGIACASFIKQQNKHATCFVIGEDGLIQAFQNEELKIVKDENCDYVVIGIDRKITYEKFATACLAIRNGATFISTNPDITIPTERGLLPGNGALTSVIALSTGKKPIFIGKPETIIVHQAIKLLQVPKTDILMVGDNYNTDIQAGIKSGIDTLLVFSGVTQINDLQHVKQKPTYYINRLNEWKIV